MTDSEIDEILAGLPIEAKVGQIFMVGIDPTLSPHQARHFMRKHCLGGAFLARRNLASVEESVSLLAHLRGTDPVLPPPFLAIDEEGGFVSNIDHLTTTAPSALAQAAGGLETVRACALATGEKLRALGFNTVFAPVADVNDLPENPVIGIRSFGSDPQAVARSVVAAIEGYTEAGVASCIKHFPGHGHTTLDSHLTLPSVARGPGDIEGVDLVPFREGMRAGAPLVMSAHVAYPGLGEDRPATWSPLILHDLLRFRMGFGGVLVTDAMEMKGVDGMDSAIRAIDAGADLLLYAFGGENAIETLHGVMRAVRDKEILESRLHEALRRVLRVRASLREPIGEGERQEVLSSRHERALEEAHDRGVILLGGSVPKIASRMVAIHPVSQEPLRPLAMDAFVEAMRPIEVVAVPTSFDPDQEELVRIAMEARSKVGGTPAVPVAVFTHSRGPINGGQRKLAELARSFGDDALGVASMNPYDAASFPPSVKTRFATLGTSAATLRALAKVLRGEIAPRPPSIRIQV